LSLMYWGMIAYGVKENNLKPGNKSFSEIQEEMMDSNSDETFLVDIGGRKKVQLCLQIGEEDSYLGYCASFPWDIAGTMDAMFTPGDIILAIAKFLEPYGYEYEDIRKSCEEFNEVLYG